MFFGENGNAAIFNLQRKGLDLERFQHLSDRAQHLREIEIRAHGKRS